MVRQCAGGSCARCGDCPSRDARVGRERHNRRNDNAADTRRELFGERGDGALCAEVRGDREAEVHRRRRRRALGRRGVGGFADVRSGHVDGAEGALLARSLHRALVAMLVAAGRVVSAGMAIAGSASEHACASR
jgi:hypothetical protein